ncbi:MAG TPA: OsmC family protein [Terriglobales bacterium]
MNQASVRWINHDLFEGEAVSRPTIALDAGKEKSANSPVDLVLIALCGCTAADVASILRKKREPFTSLEVAARGERASTPPMVFTAIHLTYRVGGRISHKAVEDAVRLSEDKYCSVAAMLKKTAKITYQIEYAG